LPWSSARIVGLPPFRGTLPSLPARGARKKTSLPSTAIAVSSGSCISVVTWPPLLATLNRPTGPMRPPSLSQKSESPSWVSSRGEFWFEASNVAFGGAGIASGLPASARAAFAAFAIAA